MSQSVPVPDGHADILDKMGFAHAATIGPNGEPQSQPVWYEWSGERLRFSTIKPRQKYRNLARDPRIALSICDPEDPYRSLEVRGRVEIEDDPSAELIEKLSRRYLGKSFGGRRSERVIVTVTPTHVTTYGPSR